MRLFYIFTCTLLLCSVNVSIQYESPPKGIDVDRPTGIYSYGKAGVYMDDRFATVLSCSAVGIPEPSYTWEFNGRALSSSDGVDGGVLTISDQSQNDDGIYQCFASNIHGTTMSRKYNLQLAYQDPFANQPSVEHRFTEGEDVLIHCRAPNGAPPPRIFWTEGTSTRPMKQNQRISYTSDGDLYFANVVKDDAKLYFCFAGNDLLGSYMRSPAHTLFVADGNGQNFPAHITHKPQPMLQGLRTEKIEMVCLASGFPTPEVVWLKNNVVVANQTLTFNSLAFENAGVYKCRATNSENTTPDEATILLTVVSAPYSMSIPADMTLAPGESGQIYCDMGGVPTPDIRWFENGQEPRQSDTYVIQGNVLLINNPRVDESTVFQCIASNAHGEELASCTITILGQNCIRNDSEVQRLSRRCLRNCTDDDVCRGKRKCVCDDICGSSCIPTERANYCPALQSSQYLDITIASETITFGSIAIYTCKTGYSPQNMRHERQCLGNRNWSDLTLECSPDQRANYCSLPQHSSDIDITIASETITFGSIAIYTCKTGYVRHERQCLGNRDWSEVTLECSPDLMPWNCQIPNPPIDGEISEYINHNIIIYSCHAGYLLVGETHSTCLENSVWSHPTPQCEGIWRCQEPDTPINGQIAGNVNGVVTFSCLPGYTLVGFHHTTCLTNRTWSNQTPRCQAPCEIDTFVNGNIRYVKFGKRIPLPVHGVVRNFVCNHGYKISGIDNSECYDGEWTSGIPGCIEAVTTQVIPMDNGNTDVIPTTQPLVMECPSVCSLIRQLVCGTDGNTYPSPCFLQMVACLNNNPTLMILHRDAC